MESQSTATENLLQYEPRKTSSTWILQHIMLANLKYTNKPGFGQIAVMNYEERQHDWWLQEITKEAPHEAAAILHPWQDVFRLAVMYVHAQAFVTWLNAIYLRKTGHSTCKLQIYAHVLRDEISRFAILTRQGLISLVCHCGLQGFCCQSHSIGSALRLKFPVFPHFAVRANGENCDVLGITVASSRDATAIKRPSNFFCTWWPLVSGPQSQRQCRNPNLWVKWLSGFYIIYMFVQGITSMKKIVWRVNLGICHK